MKGVKRFHLKRGVGLGIWGCSSENCYSVPYYDTQGSGTVVGIDFKQHFQLSTPQKGGKEKERRESVWLGDTKLCTQSNFISYKII
jgi:hypothetical protein